VKGKDVGRRALSAAVVIVLKYVVVTKPVVQMAVCLLLMGIHAVGRNIAKRDGSVALERPFVVPMNGNAVEKLV
jgi:hypothetical protein